MQTYIVDRLEGKIASFLLDEQLHPLEIHLDDPGENVQAGEILIGRVMQVAWNIRAAFIDIGCGRNCYLPVDEHFHPFYTKKGSSDRIQQGDELIVQVERPAMKTKAPALSASLTLKGRYLLLGTRTKETGVSKKIAEPERSQLRALGEELASSVPERSLYILIRTNAAEAERSQIIEEFHSLLMQLDRLIDRAPYLSASSRLFTAGAPWQRRMVDLSEAMTGEILIEDEDLFKEAQMYLETGHPELSGLLRHYEDSQWPMEKRFDLKRMMRDASGRKVWLRSGAYLVIDPTEALTCIDVNTGKIGPGKRKSEKQDTFLKINLEAAKEIARQLRLRNISGIIIIDFINLELQEHRVYLMEQLGKWLSQDPVPARVVDMTPLGLVEVTRKKTERAFTYSSPSGQE